MIQYNIYIVYVHVCRKIQAKDCINIVAEELCLDNSNCVLYVYIILNTQTA